MDHYDADSITAFDALYTTNQIQMLKILFPYLQPEIQPHIAVYIKFHELLVALRISKSNTSCSPIFHKKKDMDLPSLTKELSPFLSNEEREMLKNLSQMQDMFENFQQITQLMQLMEGTDNSPDSILSQFLSEEQMSMFKMFQEDLS